MSRSVLLGIVLLSACVASLAAEPVPPRLHEITDADTRAWWQATEALSNDGTEGRDIGSVGYDRAAKLVASRFAAAGLKPRITGSNNGVRFTYLLGAGHGTAADGDEARRGGAGESGRVRRRMNALPADVPGARPA